MKKILVTGATGFVGSHVLEALQGLAAGRVVAACRRPEKLATRSDAEIRVGDLRDAAYLDTLLEGVGVVCHTAAWTSLWGQQSRSDALFLQPTLRLIDLARAASVRRFIFISTTSAAAPESSSDPMSPGIPRTFWPHLCNVVKIEDRLRDLAAKEFCAINLRIGLFAGRRYNLGLFPILLPRLRTHLVPWVGGGETGMPITDGRDIGQAAALAATAENLHGYEAFNIVGPEIPRVREVVDYLHRHYGYPRPHFGISFSLAYRFAALMERLDRWVSWEPLVTRSIVHLLEETGADNTRAEQRLGYHPRYHWQESVDAQLEEMAARQTSPMRMHVRVS